MTDANYEATKTVYQDVHFEGKGKGTLKLYENRLAFNTSGSSTVYTLPWKKVEKRYVSSSTSSSKTRLVLKSGTEVVFEMDDRVSLEVLRDDLSDRLREWKKNNPIEEEAENEAVNKTRNRESGKRQSTPYSFAKPEAPSPLQQRESQPYRMAKKEKEPASTQRESQPYRMKAKEKPKAEERTAQPYRFVAKDKSKNPSGQQRTAQPYSYVGKR